MIQATIVDAEGRIYRQVYGDAFDLPMFIGPLKELLSGQARQTLSVENVWLKVKLYCTVYDPASGKYKFNYSLFVELFAGITFLGALGAFALRELRRQGRSARTTRSAATGLTRIKAPRRAGQRKIAAMQAPRR